MVGVMRRVVLRVGLLGLGGVLGWSPSAARAEVPPPATTAFDAYVTTVEAGLAQEHRSHQGFLAGSAATSPGQAQLHRGETVIEELKTPKMPDAMLHDWRGSAFAPGAKAADFEKLLRDFDEYSRVFAPQVTAAHALAADSDRAQGTMRVKQKHGITVVLDTTCDVRFGRLDPQDGWSASRSTRVLEIADAGTSRERALAPNEEHGFLWRINTYWSWQERDGGLYLQVESVSLTRAIPTGLGWIVGPFVESVPRESLEFTLHAAAAALGVRRGAVAETSTGNR